MAGSASAIQTVSPGEILPILEALVSQDPTRLKEGTTALENMLKTTGTLASLYEIASEKSVSLPVRQLAIIQFKNAIENWRFKRLFSDNEKMRVRKRWHQFLDEEDDTIANCNSLILGKIARYDYPHAWPTMLLDLFAVIEAQMKQETQSNLVLYRALHVLNKILKELAAQKMLAGMRNMAQVIEQYADLLVTYYSAKSVAFTSQVLTRESIETPRTLQDCRIADLMFKCSAKIATWIWHRLEKLSPDSPGRQQYETWITTFFQNSTSMLQLLVQQRYNITQSAGIESVAAKSCVEIITKHTLHYGKMFLRMSSLSHSRFVALPGCDDLVAFYWQQVTASANAPSTLTFDSPQALYPVRFIVQGMVLFRDNLRQRSPERRDGSPNPNALSREAVEEAVNLIVIKFMPLKPDDIQGWASDPEEWLTSEDKENQQWEYEIRPCSERVLVTLAVHFPEYITPILKDVFSQISQPVSTTDPNDLFRKEALYAALGLCCRQVKDEVPFTEWINQVVLAEVRKNDEMSRVIKRRVAWLIGKWVREDCPTPNPMLLWEVVLHLLQDRGSGSDMVVRLTAAQALKDCVDALDFQADLFSPLLPNATAELLRVMDEADTMECKRRVDDSLNTLIEQAGLLITPCAGIIAQAIPGFWEESGTDWQFKTTMLTTVTSLVQAMKESGYMADLISNLINDSLTPQSLTHLDEFALGLWVAALRNAASANFEQSPLFALFPLILRMPTLAEDLYGRIIDILCSYFLLAGPTLLQMGANDIFQTVQYMMQHTAIVNNSRDLLRGVSGLVQTCPSSVWGESMHVSRFFPYILTLLFNSKTSGIISTEVVYLIGRIAMADLQVFGQLMKAAAGPEITSLENDETLLYKILLDKWWDKFDSMSEPQNRKLSAMAMAALVSTGRPEVMQRLSGEIFNMWTDVFAEVREDQRRLEEENEEDGDASNPFLKLWEFDVDGLYKDAEGTAEYARRKAIHENDPVRTIPLKNYIGEAVTHSRRACGSDFDSKYLADVDQTVLAQLMKELS